MLPDWAPNLHPLVVHFPISLLAAAALVDVIGLFWRSSRGMRMGAVVLYAAGAVGALAAYVTGNQAAETVVMPTEAIVTLNTHQDLAFYTLIFFGTFALVRIVLAILRPDPSMAFRIPVVVVGILGQVLVWQTGEQGGRLVFEHGVGVAAVQEMDRELRSLRLHVQPGGGGPSPIPGGGYEWAVGPGADEAFQEAFRFVAGAAEWLSPRVEQTEAGYALALTSAGETVMFVAGEDLAAVDAEVEVDLSDFSGSLALVHHVHGRDSYHYLSLADRATLGRVAAGTDESMGGAVVSVDGWTTLRVTGDRGHFYGYVDQATVAHGHSRHPDPGPAGLRIEGEGTLRLRRLAMRPLM
jgi:uncharacterized membrane protein